MEAPPATVPQMSSLTVTLSPTALNSANSFRDSSCCLTSEAGSPQMSPVRPGRTDRQTDRLVDQVALEIFIVMQVSLINQ